MSPLIAAKTVSPVSDLTWEICLVGVAVMFVPGWPLLVSRWVRKSVNRLRLISMMKYLVETLFEFLIVLVVTLIVVAVTEEETSSVL